MKAKLKNGLVVDVRVYMLNSGLGDSRTLYMDNYRGITYYEDELEFLSDTKNRVVEGWLTKEKDNDMKDIIMLHEDEPRLEWQPLSDTYSYESMGKVYWLPDILFPDLTYENSPKRVNITITPME